MELSPHFDLAEMSHSDVALRLGLDNTPNDAAVAELGRLCELGLEPVRWLLGTPLHINSGFRSPEVNKAIGGAVTSAHMEGRAADFVPAEMELHQAFDTIARTRIPFDQLILECGAWIHLGMAKQGSEPRRQVMKAEGGPGHWVYTLVASV